MPPRSPEAIWRQLVNEAGDEAVDQAAAVSVAQAERDLARAGFDVAGERAVALARVAALATAGRR